LKKQAELALKKRKREEGRKLTAADETDAKPLASIEGEGEGEGEGDNVADDKNTAQYDDVKPAKPSKIVFDSTNLPEFLPEEYLQDDSDSEASPLASEQPAKRIQKAKFASIVEKKPKDRRKGSTIYRVAETSSRKLAPKASLGARNMKQDWLQGRSGSGIGASRKAFNTGFFKKK
jgi:U3 small nucleolar RNA-associated protein 16